MDNEPLYLRRKKKPRIGFRQGLAWTPEEDRMLRTAVEMFNGHVDRWNKIAEMVPGRDNRSCRKRWLHSINPDLIKGPWSQQEDDLLREAYAQYPGQWAKISKLVPGRKDDQCSKRWREVLNPFINRTPWEPAEDVLLLDLVKEHGHLWEKISKSFNGRPGLHCRLRHKKLMKTAALDGGASINATRTLVAANGLVPPAPGTFAAAVTAAGGAPSAYVPQSRKVNAPNKSSTVQNSTGSILSMLTDISTATAATATNSSNFATATASLGLGDELDEESISTDEDDEDDENEADIYKLLDQQSLHINSTEQQQQQQQQQQKRAPSYSPLSSMIGTFASPPPVSATSANLMSTLAPLPSPGGGGLGGVPARRTSTQPRPAHRPRGAPGGAPLKLESGNATGITIPSDGPVTTGSLLPHQLFMASQTQQQQQSQQQQQQQQQPSISTVSGLMGPSTTTATGSSTTGYFGNFTSLDAYLSLNATPSTSTAQQPQQQTIAQLQQPSFDPRSSASPQSVHELPGLLMTSSTANSASSGSQTTGHGHGHGDGHSGRDGSPPVRDIYGCGAVNCNQSFATTSMLTQHIRQHHPEVNIEKPNSKIFVCRAPGCDKAFKSFGGLVYHTNKSKRTPKVDSQNQQQQQHQQVAQLPSMSISYGIGDQLPALHS